jgi:VanZ family protein
MRRKVIAWGLAAAWMGLIFAVSSVTSDEMPAAPPPASYVAHFGEYAILAVLLSLALRTTAIRPGWAVVVAAAAASLYGASDELHQWFVPGRYSDPRDWATDTAGALAGALLTWWLGRRQPKWAKEA